jgi:hypothetical protein
MSFQLIVEVIENIRESVPNIIKILMIDSFKQDTNVGA